MVSHPCARKKAQGWRTRLLACARKIQAERIYTWNARHFQMVAPDLAGRIMTP
jgi:hypothetical protein